MAGSGGDRFIKSLANNGWVRVEAGTTLTVLQGYTQTSVRLLEVLVAGPTSFGQLGVGGTAHLRGTLNVARVNGYVPHAGDALAIPIGPRNGTTFTRANTGGYTVDYSDVGQVFLRK